MEFSCAYNYIALHVLSTEKYGSRSLSLSLFFCSFFPPFGSANQQQLLCNITLYRVGNCTIARPRLLPFSINLLISFDCASFYVFFFLGGVALGLDESVMSMLPLCHHQFRFFLVVAVFMGRKCLSWPGRRTTPIVCCGQIKKKNKK